ncbi:hypothetical protein CVE34_10990 [Pseudomonas syringae pv. actinidiae]|nr:hypothetical protein [Pseudomonas syringae pv. actinidiae]
MTYLLGDEIAAHTRLLRASPLGHLDTTEGALLHTVKNDCLIRCAGIVKFIETVRNFVFGHNM